jgi:hypothetical protein
MKKNILTSLLLLLCFHGICLIIPSAFAMPSYTLKIIDVPYATQTDVFGLNDNGYIVGRYYFEGTRGFVYDGDIFTTVDYPDPPRLDTSVHGINNSNLMVGVYADENGVNHGFIYDGQTFRSIDYPGKLLTQTSGIDDAGNIVGNSRDTQNTGFLYSNDEFSDINPPNASESYASGINNQGIIVGNYGVWDNLFYRYGFSYDGNEYTTISYPGARHTSAQGNNDNGAVVGFYSDNIGGGIHGFVALENNMFSFDIPGAYRTWAYDINNLNQIVGKFTDSEGNGHGFVITLISEPEPQIYSCTGFRPPCDNGPVKVKKNRVIPFRAVLVDSEGFPVTDVTVESALPLVKVIRDAGTPDATEVTEDALPAGHGTEGNEFVFSDGEWHYNLSTKSYSSSGTYTVTIESPDQSTYVIEPTCTGIFTID